MQKKDKGWGLIVGLVCLGLTAVSMMVSAAGVTAKGTPYCEERVTLQYTAAKQKNGSRLAANARENMMIRCSEETLGLTLDQLLNPKTSALDKEARCQSSVRFARQNGLENSGRSDEQLASVCQSLPYSHDFACGFPENAAVYFEVRDGQCVAQSSFLLQQQLMAKRDPNAKAPVIGAFDEGSGSTGEGGAAESAK